MEELEELRKKVMKQSIESQKSLQESKDMEEVIHASIEKGLRNIFGEKPEDQKFINVGRIPLICKDVRDLRQDMATVKTDIKWIKSGMNKVIWTPIVAILLAITIFVLQGYIKPFLPN